MGIRLGARVLWPTDGATRTRTTSADGILRETPGAMVETAKHGDTGYAPVEQASIQIGARPTAAVGGLLVGLGEWDL